MTKSPFLPRSFKQFAWSSTTLSLFKECPRKYQYVVVEGWVSKEESIHFRFGREYHKALQEYAIFCAKGASHREASREVVRNLLERTRDWQIDTETMPGKYKNTKTLLGLTIDYLDLVAQHDPAQTVLFPDGTPMVEVEFQFSYIPGRTEFLLCGHLDRVVKLHDEFYVKDYKTTRTELNQKYFSQFTPDNQMSLYDWAGLELFPGPLRGVMIDAARMLLSRPNEFQRGFAHRCDGQRDEYKRGLNWTLRNAFQCAELEYWPLNDTACNRFGGCQFRRVCSIAPRLRSMELSKYHEKKGIEAAWNPFYAREGEVRKLTVKQENE